MVFSPEEDLIKIYLKTQYLEPGSNPDELTEKLASFTGIDKRKDGKFLLHQVLIVPDPARIVEVLDRYNIPMSYREDDGDNEWLKAKKRAKSAMVNGALPQCGGETFTVISSRTLELMFDGVNGEMADTFNTADIEHDLDDIEGTNGDGPFGPGFRIVAVPRSFGSGGTSGDTVDDELGYLGENHVSVHKPN